MLSVTEKAKHELKKMLLARSDDTNKSLRIKLKKPAQVRLVIDEEKEGDQVIQLGGMKILLVGRNVAQIFDGVVIDVRDDQNESKLVARKIGT
jgi:Fe-S cluster assembly iron-binding protein IscA